MIWAKVAAAGLMLAPAAAEPANWLGTRWGMNKDEIARAVGVGLKRIADTPVQYEGQVHALGRSFRADFFFADGQHLSSVFLWSESPLDCGTGFAALAGYYRGQGLEPDVFGQYRMWRSPRDGDRLVWDNRTYATGACAITMGPLTG